MDRNTMIIMMMFYAPTLISSGIIFFVEILRRQMGQGPVYVVIPRLVFAWPVFNALLIQKSQNKCPMINLRICSSVYHKV